MCVLRTSEATRTPLPVLETSVTGPLATNAGKVEKALEARTDYNTELYRLVIDPLRKSSYIPPAYPMEAVKLKHLP